MSYSRREDPWFSSSYSGQYADPKSPIGGSGPGYSRLPGPTAWYPSGHIEKDSNPLGWNSHPESPCVSYLCNVSQQPKDSERLFRGKAPVIMKLLMDDFDLTFVQAAAILGNLGHECDMFRAFHERGQKMGKGGYGWAQWTGSRRKKFFEWAANNGGVFTWQDDATNYGYLKHELENEMQGAIVALKKEATLPGAVRAFEKHFERAASGKQNYENRELLARIAMEEYITYMQSLLGRY